MADTRLPSTTECTTMMPGSGSTDLLKLNALVQHPLPICVVVAGRLLKIVQHIIREPRYAPRQPGPHFLIGRFGNRLRLYWSPVATHLRKTTPSPQAWPRRNQTVSPGRYMKVGVGTMGVETLGVLTGVGNGGSCFTSVDLSTFTFAPVVRVATLVGRKPQQMDGRKDTRLVDRSLRQHDSST
ncbi:hypothetical protein KC327_g89 [Hortaea werneckii]|nr:hypothetical protein KC327_g89 [Hortaea werneckii]